MTGMERKYSGMKSGLLITFCAKIKPQERRSGMIHRMNVAGAKSSESVSKS